MKSLIVFILLVALFTLSLSIDDAFAVEYSDESSNQEKTNDTHSKHDGIIENTQPPVQKNLEYYDGILKGMED